MRQSAEALKSDNRVAVNKIIIAHIKSVFDFGHNRADTFVRPHHAVGVKSASPLQNDRKIIYCAGINVVVFYSVRERYRAAVKCADNLLNLPPQLTPSTSTDRLQEELHKQSDAVKKLIRALASAQMSKKEMMTAVDLKDRTNFEDYYLAPALNAKIVRMLYPNSPNHPKQKYLLTKKGVCYTNC